MSSAGSRRSLPLGVHRESMTSNPLLVKPELGKSRRSCCSLPPTEFTYGMKNVCINGGAAEAMSSWTGISAPAQTRRPKPPQTDFIAMNRLAAKSGLTNAHEQSQFRATHDIRVRDRDSNLSRKGPRIPEDMTFGISTRPCTPISHLLENRYHTQWVQDKRESEKKERIEIRRRKLGGKVYETRASLMRHYCEPIDHPPLWRMKRFSKIPARLTTFRTEKERTAAFNHHALDSTARSGVFGHGIYNTA